MIDRTRNLPPLYTEKLEVNGWFVWDEDGDLVVEDGFLERSVEALKIIWEYYDEMQDFYCQKYICKPETIN